MIVAKFENKTKEQIYNRDWKICVICWTNSQLQFHHVFFWTESNYESNRNQADQWVTICCDCHLLAHSCKQWEWVRQEAIDYLNNL